MRSIVENILGMEVKIKRTKWEQQQAHRAVCVRVCVCENQRATNLK